VARPPAGRSRLERTGPIHRPPTPMSKLSSFAWAVVVWALPAAASAQVLRFASAQPMVGIRLQLTLPVEDSQVGSVRYERSSEDVLLRRIIEKVLDLKSPGSERPKLRAVGQPAPPVPAPLPAPVPPSAVDCPKCGSAMARRTATRGANEGKSFWGCTAFPACRGTRPI
jgi:hypothetical protein